MGRPLDEVKKEDPRLSGKLRRLGLSLWRILVHDIEDAHSSLLIPGLSSRADRGLISRRGLLEGRQPP